MRERYVEALEGFRAVLRIAPGNAAALNGSARVSKILRSLGGTDLVRKQTATQASPPSAAPGNATEKPVLSATTPPTTADAASATANDNAPTAAPASVARPRPDRGQVAAEQNAEFDRIKAKGNALVKAKRYREATVAYGECIAIDPTQVSPLAGRAPCASRVPLLRHCFFPRFALAWLACRSALADAACLLPPWCQGCAVQQPRSMLAQLGRAGACCG